MPEIEGRYIPVYALPDKQLIELLMLRIEHGQIPYWQDTSKEHPVLGYEGKLKIWLYFEQEELLGYWQACGFNFDSQSYANSLNAMRAEFDIMEKLAYVPPGFYIERRAM